MAILKNCSSCGRQTKEFAAFPCPACGEETIVRCRHCRVVNEPFKCTRCGREGP